MEIAIVGLGYVGTVSAACFATAGHSYLKIAFANGIGTHCQQEEIDGQQMRIARCWSSLSNGEGVSAYFRAPVLRTWMFFHRVRPKYLQGITDPIVQS